MRCSLCAESDNDGAVLYEVKHILTGRIVIMCDDCWEALDDSDYEIVNRTESG